MGGRGEAETVTLSTKHPCFIFELVVGRRGEEFEGLKKGKRRETEVRK
jgi:hypothetical protein